MVFAIALLLAILLGGAVGTLVLKDAGYVLINYGDTVVETSIWVAAIILIAVYVLLRLVSLLVRKLGQGQLKMLRWRSSRRLDAAKDQTVRGVLVLAEERWADARKLLLEGARHTDTPVVNYLGAARASQALGDRPARDEQLERAVAATPSAKFAATLARAEFLIEDGRYDEAADELLTLRRRAPRHRAVLSALAVCLERQQSWAPLTELLPQLRKQQVLPEAELDQMERTAWEQILDGRGAPGDVWKKVPKTLQADGVLMRNWVQRYDAAGNHDMAEQAARLALSVAMDDELVEQYGNIRSSDPAAQFNAAQKWHRQYPDNASIALALGRLCLQTEQFPRAREYFETSLRLRPSDAVYGELGRLCVALGDERRGTEYLLHGLGDLADLPQPEAPIIRKTGP